VAAKLFSPMEARGGGNHCEISMAWEGDGRCRQRILKKYFWIYAEAENRLMGVEIFNYDICTKPDVDKYLHACEYEQWSSRKSQLFAIFKRAYKRSLLNEDPF
jgi:hypothetical protein